MRPVCCHAADQRQGKTAHHGRLDEPPFSLLDDHHRDQESRYARTPQPTTDGKPQNITTRSVATRLSWLITYQPHCGWSKRNVAIPFPYITAQQAAEEVGLSYSRMRQLLNEGRIKGAFKTPMNWLIPSPVEILPRQSEQP